MGRWYAKGLGGSRPLWLRLLATPFLAAWYRRRFGSNMSRGMCVRCAWGGIALRAPEGEE